MTERRSLARKGRLAAALLILTVLFGGSLAADDQLPAARAKNASVRIDGKTGNAGTGGTATRDSSNDNRVALGRLSWDHESVLLIEKQADWSDGIVGHNLFDDKVIEFNFDAVPERAAAWRKALRETKSCTRLICA